MFEEIIPVVAHRTDVVLEMPADLCMATDVHPAPPTPEQLRATDAVFAARAEQEHVARLLGLYSGTMLLRDLTVDALAQKAYDDRRREEEKDREGEDANQ